MICHHCLKNLNIDEFENENSCVKCLCDNLIKQYLSNKNNLPNFIIKKFDTYYLLYKNGNIKYECRYIYSKKNGLQILYYDNQQIKEQAFYINDLLEGYYEKWYENGKLKYQAYYENGVFLFEKYFENL